MDGEGEEELKEVKKRTGEGRNWASNGESRERNEERKVGEAEVR